MSGRPRDLRRALSLFGDEASQAPIEELPTAGVALKTGAVARRMRQARDR